eukprot:TRINITY_DN1897_c0_g3_i1.p1 TRINITY_DN1897_c0_g3~~TRINITY_DN1897_c0_g3_i1.p1  ORF type:complete len:105 (-),score=23.60 TRINITY_DN1897_c0_g3_i1:1278-1592(-)
MKTIMTCHSPSATRGVAIRVDSSRFTKGFRLVAGLYTSASSSPICNLQQHSTAQHSTATHHETARMLFAKDDGGSPKASARQRHKPFPPTIPLMWGQGTRDEAQ